MELRSGDCLREVMAIHGVLGASLVDYHTGVTIDSTGREPNNAADLVYFVGGRPDVLPVLYVWLDRLIGNLAMAQHRIRLLTQDLVTD